MKRIISIAIVSVVALSVFTINVFAGQWVNWTRTTTLGALGNNTLIITLARAGETYNYERYRWNSGTANAIELFMKGENGNWIMNKQSFPGSYKGDGIFHNIYYCVSVDMGEEINLYGEQSNIRAKTVDGTLSLYYD